MTFPSTSTKCAAIGDAKIGEEKIGEEKTDEEEKSVKKKQMNAEIGDLPLRGRIFVDSAPIIYYLEGHPVLGPRFKNLFDRAEAGAYQLVISTVSLAEVLTGPLRQGNEQLADDYRQALTRPPIWRVADLTVAIAHRAARIRCRTRLRLPDAVQVATALEMSCVALVSPDRDFRALDESTERITVYS